MLLCFQFCAILYITLHCALLFPNFLQQHILWNESYVPSHSPLFIIHITMKEETNPCLHKRFTQPFSKTVLLDAAITVSSMSENNIQSQFVSVRTETSSAEVSLFLNSGFSFLHLLQIQTKWKKKKFYLKMQLKYSLTFYLRVMHWKEVDIFWTTCKFQSRAN